MLYKDKSDIDGYGLFSDTAIAEGELVGEFEIVKSVYNTKYSIWVDCIRYRATNILKYSNHSSTHNACVDFPYVTANQDIEPGVEITWDYGGEFESE